ncbi:hypothetical protein GC093_14615 [Paenibacillus sp. LMG 31456]|uniref:Carbohydrate-binding/sugar hydrolysis domain-containing protein n=1 Tax=Paenibacillus foliorum TaxID=2654974 RepID=A0A972GX26_9BACL|nr:NosD domain-containing protein [Paenibacillus foliorum]NOU94440.1 hypothetical protein [Paenibacillus foliorum]
MIKPLNKRVAIHLCLLMSLWGWGVALNSAFAAEPPSPVSLQQLIDATPAGGILKLPTVTYQEAVIVKKPISIISESNATIVNKIEDRPAIRIEADNVLLKGISVVQEGRGETSAVLLKSSHNIIDSLDIRTQSFGIQIQDGSYNEIKNTSIRRNAQESGSYKLTQKRNGIDLFNAHDNVIIGNTISSMFDGIYLESSHRNRLENNRIDHSRYGVHCMYTEGTLVKGNTGMFNITGAMVMGVKGAEVSGNTFIKQYESVNSQGLLFFDVQGSRIRNNKVEGNRVGLYIEQSHDNEFENNEVSYNFVGVQFIESESNRFTLNDFIGNVIEAQATDSQNNSFSGNFWDAFRGIDTNGDKISELPYRINPFFQRLTSKNVAYQLFFQSPGMQFLESMSVVKQSDWSIDRAPLMKPVQLIRTNTDAHSSSTQLLVSTLLLLLSVITIYFLGVKRR